MKQFTRFIFVLTFLTILISCSNDEAPIPDPNITFEATLNGAQSVPANNATTSGTALLTFNNDTKVFTITVTHNIASPTNGHIHKAAVGENGGPVFPFTNFTSPINFTSDALDASQEADLKAGLYYVNIHTQDFPGGEIRGQLIDN